MTEIVDKSVVVEGEARARRLAETLIGESVTFTVEPEPDDFWKFTVARDDAVPVLGRVVWRVWEV